MLVAAQSKGTDEARVVWGARPRARASVDLARVHFEFTFTRAGKPICCDDPYCSEERPIRYHGRIFLYDEDFRGEADVGEFELYEFRAPFDPEGDNEGLSDLMADTEHAIVFRGIQEHAPSMEEYNDEFGPGLSKVVYLARLVVKPPYRRQGIASAWLWRVLELYEDQWPPVGVFLMPAPLRDSGGFYYMENGRPKELSPEERAEFELRKQDLIRLYERAGFKRLGTSDIWGLNLDNGLPPKPAVLDVED